MAYTAKDIIEDFANEFGITKVQAKKQVDFLLKNIKSKVATDNVKLFNFGTFKKVNVKGAIMGKAYNTNVVRFKAAKDMNQRVK